VSQGWVGPRCGWQSQNWLLCQIYSASWLVSAQGEVWETAGTVSGLAGLRLRKKSGGVLVLCPVWLGYADWFVYRFEVILVRGWVSYGGCQLGLTTEDSG